MDYLWSMNKHKKVKTLLLEQWINKMKNEYNEEFEGTKERKDNEEILNDKKQKARILISDLYQKYARLLTQNKVVIGHKLIMEHNDSDIEEKNEDEASNEEIEGYFSKSLEYNGSNVETLQGFAAFYISINEHIHALPFLQKAKSLNKWNSSTYIQLSRLC